MNRLLTILALFLAFQTMYAQSEILINKTWESSFGAPNDYEWAASILDNGGNLITTGHSTLDDTNTELLLTKQDPDGDILWQEAFQLSENTKNGGVTLAIDVNDNIYIGGVTSTSSSTDDFDFLILKYNSSGTKIWHQTFNGTGNGMDVPTAIIADQTKVYICGASKGLNTGIDYWALKLNASNGSLTWQKRYDFAGLDDYPVSMVLDGSGNIVLTGSSAENLLNWEVATVKYGSSSGSLIGEERVGNDTLSFSQPSGIAKDPNGNFIISGITTSDGTNFDIRTIKLTDNLDLAWVQDYDSGSKTDSASAVVCGSDGSVVITGWCSNQQQGTEFLTLKYESDGTLAWTRKRTVNPSGTLSKSRAAVVDSDGNVTVAGDLRGSIVVTQYDTAGNINWEKELKNVSALSNRPLGLLLGPDDEIFITSILRNQEGKSYATYKLNTFQRIQEQVLNQQEEPSHIKGEIIVRFKPGVVSTAFVDNTDLRYGTIGEIFKDSSCLDAIADKLLANDFSEWTAVKIHRNMTTADSVAITRLGKTIRVPDFYNTFVLLVPQSYRRIVGEGSISDTLESDNLRCCVSYAEDNPVVTPDVCEPDDPVYTNQGNLHPTSTYPNGHINMEPAWCIAGAGSSGTKVSIIDTGVRWSHEDFGDGTFSGSVIVDGMDYATGAPISGNNENDVTDHGTRVASVVGSIRNNATGVAGIAGGSGSADGVRLVAQRAFVGGADILVEAFGDAVDDYGVQIINCSGGFTPSDPPIGNSLAMREALHHANRMGVIVCASRGNVNSFEPPDAPRYPGTAQDEWVICVGGTGTNGNYNPQCRFGDVIDIAAPSRWQLTRSAQNADPVTGIPSDQAYGGISFTSGATPHASGLAALMLSYYESISTQLVQEDIEYIIQASATDVGDTGYDPETGHGRINAGAALQMIERPMCNVFHFGTDENPNTKTDELIEEDVTLELTEPFTTEGGQTFDKGTYTADVYKVTATVSHPLPANNSITHYWERHSSSTVFRLYDASGNQNELQPVEIVKINGTPTNSSTTLEGYVYYLKNSTCSIEGWIPAAPEDAELTYSVIGCSMTGTDEVSANSLQLYPNPASGQLTLSLADNSLSDFSTVSIYDFSGRQMVSKLIRSQNHQEGFVTFDIGHFPRGIYTCVLHSEGKVSTAKFTKF